MDKLWDPKVFNKVLDNWNENPFTEITLLDFTTEEFRQYWDKSYVPPEGEELKAYDPKVFDCPAGFEEIGLGYWYGMKDGCICAKEFGGVINNGKYPPLSFDMCN